MLVIGQINNRKLQFANVYGIKQIFLYQFRLPSYFPVTLTLAFVGVPRYFPVFYCSFATRSHPYKFSLPIRSKTSQTVYAWDSNMLPLQLEFISYDSWLRFARSSSAYSSSNFRLSRKLASQFLKVNTLTAHRDVLVIFIINLTLYDAPFHYYLLYQPNILRDKFRFCEIQRIEKVRHNSEQDGNCASNSRKKFRGQD